METPGIAVIIVVFDLVGFTIIAVIGILLAIIVGVRGNECPKCGSQETITWIDNMEEENTMTHAIVHSRNILYCRTCCKFTMPYPHDVLEERFKHHPSYRRAMRHYQNHHKENLDRTSNGDA